MPKALCTVPDTVETILRPVVLDITRQVFDNTEITKDIQILFPGDLDRAQQQGGSINTKDKDTVKFPFTSQMGIEVQEDYIRERMLNDAVMKPENQYIFLDDKLETSMRPVYSSTETTLTFKYRAKDKTEAIRWRDQIKNRTSQNREHFVHDVKYYYLIPLELVKILEVVHDMRETVAGYGESFEQWFYNNRSSRFKWLTNLAGEQGRWGVAETQLRVQGGFDFEGVPEVGSKEDDADTWTISFNYKFQYDKPIGVQLYYPLMIHNQLIDQKYRPSAAEMPPYQIEDQAVSYSKTSSFLSNFEAGAAMYPHTRRPGVSIPSFDEFLPAQIIPRTLRVFTALVSLDLTPGNNPRFLLNLRDLGGDFSLDPSLDCCLQTEWPYMTNPLQSIFNLSLYRSAYLMQPEYLTMDANLNVYSTVDLDPREYYHLRFSIHQNLRDINPAALKRFQKCPDCLSLILETLEPTLVDRGILPCVVGDVAGKILPTKCLDTAIDTINKTKPSDIHFYTVMGLFVRTHHQNRN